MTTPLPEECKRCGLLKSTILATGKLCVSLSTVNIPAHDFGESTLLPEEWIVDFDAKFVTKGPFGSILGKVSYMGREEKMIDEVKSFIRKLLLQSYEQGKREERERIKSLRTWLETEQGLERSLDHTGEFILLADIDPLQEGKKV